MKGKLLGRMLLALAPMTSCGTDKANNYDPTPLPGVNAPQNAGTDTAAPGSTPANDTAEGQPKPVPVPGSSAKLSFAKDVAPMLKASCVADGCHSTEVKRANVDVESFAGAKASNPQNIASVKANRMPVGNFPKLKPEDITKLEKWAADGFQP